MTHESLTPLSAAEIIARAKEFFAERVPNNAAYPEREGPGFLTLRGQGGEEIALAIRPAPDGNRVRASTLFFDQAVARFLSTLPQLSRTG
ncbi:MAG TPA: hypothetical protein VGQ69_01975 [Gemmatimonadales bacterium]|jgi:hypothetical protein|nr:hypothetical protein [Gemmatimonadales bacterium]